MRIVSSTTMACTRASFSAGVDARSPSRWISRAMSPMSLYTQLLFSGVRAEYADAAEKAASIVLGRLEP
ncbi:hypothetical protein HG530_005245 [Fusarium avenaceum]|nr:hypothetical protein HG530_005245 [Fusarium avenaceum]